MADFSRFLNANVASDNLRWISAAISSPENQKWLQRSIIFTLKEIQACGHVTFDTIFAVAGMLRRFYIFIQRIFSLEISKQEIIGLLLYIRKIISKPIASVMLIVWKSVSIAFRLLNWLLVPFWLLKLVIRHCAAIFVLMYVQMVWKLLLRNHFYGLLHSIKLFWMEPSRAERIRALEKVMENARTYDEWRDAARALDDLEGRLQWSNNSRSAFYDYRRLKRSLLKFRDLVDKQDILGIMSYARARLQRNLCGMNDRRLYTVLRSGTKKLTEEYTNEVIRALQLVCLVHNEDINSAEKLAFFNETRHAFGRTALAFSGGATFALYHTGVVSALLECNLLPRILSGSSGGAIIVAMIGTRTDEELREMLDVDADVVNWNFFPTTGGNWGAFKRKLSRLIRHGVLLDIELLGDCVKANIPQLTFSEAYELSGRIINIVVSPASSTGNQDAVRLLNYINSPNVLVYSAALASCAIPGFYAPVQILEKNEDGQIVPFMDANLKWQDGSVEDDVPMLRLAELFNVNNSIVSQVNPHVVPLLSESWTLGGTHNFFWRNPLGKIVEYLLVELKCILLGMNTLGVLPMHSSFRYVLEQTYTGSITITPTVKPSDFLQIFTNPDKERYRQCQRECQLQSYRVMHIIKALCDIELTLDECVRRMRGELIVEELETNVERNGLEKVRSWSAEMFDKHNRRITGLDRKHSGNDFNTIEPLTSLPEDELIQPIESSSVDVEHKQKHVYVTGNSAFKRIENSAFARTASADDVRTSSSEQDDVYLQKPKLEKLDDGTELSSIYTKPSHPSGLHSSPGSSHGRIFRSESSIVPVSTEYIPFRMCASRNMSCMDLRKLDHASDSEPDSDASDDDVHMLDAHNTGHEHFNTAQLFTAHSTLDLNARANSVSSPTSFTPRHSVLARQPSLLALTDGMQRNLSMKKRVSFIDQDNNSPLLSRNHSMPGISSSANLNHVTLQSATQPEFGPPLTILHTKLKKPADRQTSLCKHQTAHDF